MWKQVGAGVWRRKGADFLVAGCVMGQTPSSHGPRGVSRSVGARGQGFETGMT
jgi:hypothetical protein